MESPVPPLAAVKADDKLRVPMFAIDENKFVELAVVEKSEVVVAFVVVERPIVPAPRLKLVANKFVEDAVVEKSEVVVAFVEVEFRKVMFCKVDEPVVRRFERVVSPPVAVSVPVKLAADEIVWPLMLPEVMRPVLREVENKFVELAVVAKKLVVVADDPVALTKVKF